MTKKTLEQELCEYLQLWNGKQMIAFLKDIIPLFNMFDTEDSSEWEEGTEAEEEALNVQIVRSAYLISRIADRHSGKLALMRVKHKDLWKRLEERVAQEGQT